MESAIDRRKFLQGAALVGAVGITGTLAGCAPHGAPKKGVGLFGGKTYADTIAWTHEYDVVVIGFGGAGAVSAITAADEGARVLLCEKAPKGHEGGNTHYSGQNFGVIDPEDIDLFIEYYKNMRGCFSTPSDSIIENWVNEFSKNEQWMRDLGCCDYELEEKTEEPSCAPEGLRAMRMKISNSVVDGNDIGGGYWPLVYTHVMKRKDKIDTWFSSPAVELIQDPVSKTVIGVVIDRMGSKKYVRAMNGVVLCCGGYEANPQMMEDYTLMARVMPIGNTYNTGDGIDMAVQVGARLWHMSNALAPWVSVKTSPDAQRLVFPPVNPFASKSYIQVGPEGKRFHNEFETNRHSRIEEQGESHTALTFDHMWNIFDEKGRIAGLNPKKGWGLVHSPQLEEQVKNGVIIKANTIEELGEAIGIEPEALANEIKAFNEMAISGKDTKYGRKADTMLPFDEAGPYYAWEVRRGVLNTQGGPERDEQCRIIDVKGNPIPQLYGAGELGFMMPKLYNGGGNLGDTAVSGRIAGRNAAQPKEPLPPLEFDMPAQKEVGAEALDADLTPDFVSQGNEYYGTFAGLSMMTCKVTMNGSKIENVEVVQHGETIGLGTVAFEKVIPQIVEKQTLDVDLVTGATKSSKGILGCCKNALKNDFPELANTAPDLNTAEEGPALAQSREEGIIR